MKKIAVISGTRADYGLLKPLISQIEADKDLELQLIVTAMHLSPEFGYTINAIKADKFSIYKEVECLLSSDTPSAISKSIAIALIGFAEVFSSSESDMIIVLGDRTEIYAAATAAMIANIPIAHIHGGETTEGAYDESIRHAITKMSYLHFTSTELYKKRVTQLGEAPNRVFNVGAIGLDSIKNLRLMSKSDFETAISFKLGTHNALITFHPVTLEQDSAEEQFSIILEELSNLKHFKLIFTYANSDKNGRIINLMIEDYVQNNTNAIAFKSLGQLRYLSALQFMDFVIGNSSSGIIEVPYFNIPTINIGDRQKGRIAPKSVLHTLPNKLHIKQTIIKAQNTDFKNQVKSQTQLYGNGTAASKIVTKIKKITINSLKKPFFDLK